MVLASPLRRTIQTALIAFAPYVQHGMKIIAVPTAQEASADPSDVGSDLETLKGWFDHDVDFRYITPDWNGKKGIYATDPKSTKERARQLRVWIKAREEHEIALVSHGDFAHYLTGDVNDKGEQTTAWWVNDEFRTFTFSEENDGEASLVETEESKALREKYGVSDKDKE